MKILHVASFMGNIGDNASHMGFARILGRVLGEFEITRLEIREFYKNRPAGERRHFDRDFVAYANGFDLLVVGGGGFFDYWVEGSATGTTIDIAPEDLDRLTVPTLFASIGSHPHKPVPPGNVEKFRRFIEQVGARPNMRILPRNDGSIRQLATMLEPDCLAGLHEILDNGFFYEQTVFDRYPALGERPYVAWNITTDQLAMNASLQDEGVVRRYYENLAAAIVAISKETGLRHVLVPHISSDLGAIVKLLGHLPDKLLRSEILVAPYGEGDLAAQFAFNIYRESRATVGMRFHSNVCPIALGVETIGLGVLERIKYVYDFFEIPQRCFDVASDFSGPLADQVCRSGIGPIPAGLLERKRQASLDAYARALGAIL